MSECQARLLPDHRRRPRLRPRPPPRPCSSCACWPSSRPPRPHHRLPRPCLPAARLSRPLSCPRGGCPRRCGGCPRRRGWSRAPSVLQAVASLFIYRAFSAVARPRCLWEKNKEVWRKERGDLRNEGGGGKETDGDGEEVDSPNVACYSSIFLCYGFFSHEKESK